MDDIQKYCRNTIEQGKGCADFEVNQRVMIIHMKEDLDHHNAIFIRQQADHLMVTRNVQYIIFDFSEVTFMDSSGIGVILGRYKKLRLLGLGKLMVTGVSDTINRILSMSGIYSVVEKYKTVAEALQHLN